MTLRVHRLLEAIVTRENIKIAPWVRDDFLVAFSRAITRAEKFDFGRIDFDTDEHGWPLVPELTDDEWDFWSDGLIVLPADPCWYEYDLIRPAAEGHATQRTGILVSSSGNNWTVIVVPLEDKFLIDGIAAKVRMRQAQIEVQDWTVTTAIASNEFMEDDFAAEDRKIMGRASEGNFDISVYLTLMLNSRTTERSRELAPQKLNRNRERRGRPPLFDHHVVRIVPERWLRPTRTDGESDRRSPRLHWRRTHLRHYDHRTPHSKSMGDSWVVAIPRQLIGRAEMGSVSHEYRVFGSG